MENMGLYNRFRETPPEAKKEIKAGRIKGFTDINPMWRIQALTDAFGPCGIGWKYTIDRKWLEPGANNEVAGFVDISLYYKLEGEWSEAVPGTGGSSFVAKEKSGLYTSDEVYKMALTDALSVACKALGIGADVYWASGRTKYKAKEDREGDQPAHTLEQCAECGKTVGSYQDEKNYKTAEEIAQRGRERYGRTLCWECQKKERERREEEQRVAAQDTNGGPAA